MIDENVILLGLAGPLRRARRTDVAQRTLHFGSANALTALGLVDEDVWPGRYGGPPAARWVSLNERGERYRMRLLEGS